jgi:hypothetical protein
LIGVLLVGGAATGFVLLGSPQFISTTIGLSAFLCFGAAMIVIGTRKFLQGGEMTVVYERGAKARDGKGSRAAAFAEVDVAYYLAQDGSATRRVMELFPASGEPPIKIETPLSPDDAPQANYPTVWQMENARDIIVEAVANRIIGTLKAGGTVAWTQGIVMSSKGVTVMDRLIPWTNLRERVDQRTGDYALLDQQGQTVASMRFVDRNFLPGWKVLRKIQRRDN